MTFKMKMRIEFYDADRKPSILIETNMPERILPWGETTLFVFYTLRQMVNLAGDATDLARFLRDGGNYALAQQAQIPNQYSGIPGERGFSAEFEFDETETHLRLYPHGFGILGLGVNHYVPLSVLVLLKCLIDRRSNDEVYTNRLSLIAHLCGDQFFKGIPMLHQIRLANAIQKQAYDQFPFLA